MAHGMYMMDHQTVKTSLPMGTQFNFILHSVYNMGEISELSDTGYIRIMFILYFPLLVDKHGSHAFPMYCNRCFILIHSGHKKLH